MTVWKRWLTLVVVLGVLFGTAVGPGAAPGSAVDPATARVDLKVLLVTDDTGYPSFGAWVALLDREGVPYDVFNQAADTLEYADLASGEHGFYQGVVCATRCTDILGFGSASMGALETFLADFELRLIHGFAPPDPIFGLSAASSEDVSGDVLSVTSAGAAAFSYLDGTVPVDDFTNGYYPSVVDPSFEPFFVGPGGAPVLGVHADPLGFDEMVMTVNSNEFQSHALLLGHGMVSWVTKGLYLGYNRNYFTAHIDDIFLPDDRWDVDDNVTYEDGCVINPCIRMVAGDVDRMMTWMSNRGIRLDMVFNGAGSVEAVQDAIDDEDPDTNSDPLTDALLAVRDQLYWVNHTYEHINLNTVSQAVIEAEIQSNLDFAAANGIAVDPVELVTGEHSGLRRDVPPVTAENPNLAPALTAKGIGWVAADNSVDSVPYTIGSATTIPRYPANVFYNVGTQVEQLDEYNWIYTLPPLGSCVNTAVTTCNAAELTWPEYVDVEASIMLPHLVSNDPRPHYFHQANLAEDGVFYTVFGEVLDRYNQFFEVPLEQPLFAEAGGIMSRAAAWDAAKDGVTAYVQAGAVYLSAPSTVTAPLTGSPLVGDVYGSERSGWLQIGATETVLDWTPPVITLTGANPQTITAGDAYVELGATAFDNVDGVIDPASIVIDATAVDTTNTGTYQVLYDVSDAAGNPAVQVVRDVEIIPVVSVSATDGLEAGSVDGVFTVSRTGPTADALSVAVDVTGSATAPPAADADYAVAVPSPVVIPVGESSVDVLVDPVDDAVAEGDETVELSIVADAAYAVGSPGAATVTIVDDDVAPSGSIVATGDNAVELFVNGVLVGSSDDWYQASLVSAELAVGDVVAVHASDAGGVAGFIGEVSWDGGSAVSDASWRVSTSSLLASDWADKGYTEDGSWVAASSYGTYGVGPWLTNVSGFPSSSSAQWIWSSDNVNDDEVWLRYTIGTPPAPSGSIVATADNSFELFVNGVLVGSSDDWYQASLVSAELAVGDVVAVHASDAGGLAGFIGEVSWDGGSAVSDASWRVSTSSLLASDWADKGYTEDGSWVAASSYGTYGVGPWLTNVSGFPSSSSAQWIWSSDNVNDDEVWLRYTIGTPPAPSGSIVATADNSFEVFVNGVLVGSSDDWYQASLVSAELAVGDVVAVHASDAGGLAGFIGEVSWDGGSAVSDASWRVSTSSLLASDWADKGYTEDGSWVAASSFGTYGVGPWLTNVSGFPSSSSAQWIWSSDNVNDDEVWLRYTIGTPPAPSGSVVASGDNSFEVFVNGVLVGSSASWTQALRVSAELAVGDVVGVHALDAGGVAGFVGEVSWDGGSAVSDASWRVSTSSELASDWADQGYIEDGSWGAASSFGTYGVGPWLTNVSGFPSSSSAEWIWSSDNVGDDEVFLRYVIAP